MDRDFDTLLIANRGEITVRIARSASRLGLRTVAVHSTADVGAPHVLAADVAVEIGPAESARSYLNAERIIDAARRTGAGAIHPGYGFLAENADFAQACAAAGLVFVGPDPAAIAAMGDKAAAKRRMREVGVPVVPGYDGEDQDDDRLCAEAAHVGFPLMVKAAAGGGGKGMRRVADPVALPAALASARRESASAFGTDRLLLERALLRPRHVEIQVLGDRHGHLIHLGERDCSVQRRNQKVIEESPSPVVDAAMRSAMGTAAVTAASAVEYVGAGTIEFLVDERGDFYFLEMNTRLQVEHAVTEMVTGLDLVEWQLRIARGEHLALAQDDVVLRGHSIEARLYAEDPTNDYLPATGTVHVWDPPRGDAVRVDSGITEGSEITPYYDPMLAKVIAHGRDRDEARALLAQALERTTVLGPPTNRALVLATLRSPVFAAGEATTAFLDDPPGVPKLTGIGIATLAAAIYARRRCRAEALAPGLVGWSSTGSVTSRQRLRIGEDVHVVIVEESPEQVVVRVGDAVHAVVLAGERPMVDGVEQPIRCVEPQPGRFLFAFSSFDVQVVDVDMVPPSDGDAAGQGVLTAPMHGLVIAVDAVSGSAVVTGQRLVVIEAMKMEHAIHADIDGSLEEIVDLGEQVVASQVIARIVPDVPSGG
ncbi:MAG: acetyl/propionyl-CoA carboxylase subuit alpha [Acidimicrobiia bacterium]